MYYTYIIKNERNNLYFGSTSDLKRRINEHNAGKSPSTQGYKWKLIYYEAYLSEADARKREHKLKQSGQAKRWLKERINNSLTQN